MRSLKSITLVLAGVVLGLVIAAVAVWNPLGVSWLSGNDGAGHAEHDDHETGGPSSETLYTCGMHPQVIQDEPGNCPICGMRLTPVKKSSAAPDHDMAAMGESGAAEISSQGERKILYWRAPMDPNYISDKPGKSPMGMDLIPVYEDEAGGSASPSGVRVDPSFLQNFAVRTALVERGSIPIDIRTIGILQHNETNVVSINTKFEGWIEKSNYNTVGEYIEKGALLFEIYSPQLVTTQQEYLAAIDYVKRLSSGSAYPEAVERAESLLESARERLQYWDITDEQIDLIRDRGKPIRTLPFYSPASGYIVGKGGESLEGMRLTPGMTVLKLADHSRLWAEVEFYEDQLRHIRKGTRVLVEVDSFPGRRWAGRVVLFDSKVDPKTRTLRAYVEVDNKDLKLVPGMYATVNVAAPAVSGAVKVPSQAVLHSGERSIVIVQTGRGVFEPREVQLGAGGDGEQEVRSGLEPGEVIVTSSQFLIDSESNLKAAIQQLLGERSRPGSPQQEPKPSAAPHQH
ncbi:MAG: efflux RND transporter periplasmic adaptor subunit [Acidobacteria bacterium]|nr:efflux RND transporter periplasmic adaptor subunit [Acidobacteriota bacterium]